MIIYSFYEGMSISDGTPCMLELNFIFKLERFIQEFYIQSKSLELTYFVHNFSSFVQFTLKCENQKLLIKCLFSIIVDLVPKDKSEISNMAIAKKC